MRRCKRRLEKNRLRKRKINWERKQWHDKIEGRYQGKGGKKRKKEEIERGKRVK